MADRDEMRGAIREASRLAFQQIRSERPLERFYLFALITTSDALRPAPSAASEEGLEEIFAEYHIDDPTCTKAELRWEIADSPYHLVGDDHFSAVEALFLARGDHHSLSSDDYDGEVELRLSAMKLALEDLDTEGFFGVGAERETLAIGVLSPGEQSPEDTFNAIRELNSSSVTARVREELEGREE